MNDGELVPGQTPVWRLPERRNRFYSRQQRQPTLEAFRPRPGERRVSVWNGDGRITIDRVIELRGKTPDEVAVVALFAIFVTRIAAEMGRDDVRVVGDPEGAPRAASVGERDLHYGIEGLGRELASSDEHHMALLSRIARSCIAVFPPAP